MDDTTRLVQDVRGHSLSPKDLASTVHLELLRRSANPPPLEILVGLFESMYFASLKTEESKPVLFHVVYLDPERPDPKPPNTLVHDRWRCIQLFPAIALNTAILRKSRPHRTHGPLPLRSI